MHTTPRFFPVSLQCGTGDFPSDISVSIGTGIQPQSQLKPKIRCCQAKAASRPRDTGEESARDENFILWRPVVSVGAKCTILTEGDQVLEPDIRANLWVSIKNVACPKPDRGKSTAGDFSGALCYYALGS